jgi:hypothetical protein
MLVRDCACTRECQHICRRVLITHNTCVQVRADGKVDVTLRPPGAKAKISDGVAKVIQMLRKGDGTLPLGDKSKPQEIYDRLGLSKKVFKEALGHLYKMHMVELTDTTVSKCMSINTRTECIVYRIFLSGMECAEHHFGSGHTPHSALQF